MIKSGPATVTAGNNLTYTITVTNNGLSDAQSVAVTDVVPAGTTFVSVVTSQGSASNSAGTITGNLGVLGAGASATETIVVTANTGDVNNSTITNTATVSSPTTDPNPNNNTSAPVVTTVSTSADVAVTKTVVPSVTAAPTSPTPSPSTMRATSDAQAVHLVDIVPAGTTFVSITQTSGSTFTFTTPGVGGTGTITGVDGTLPASNTAVFTLVVKATSSDPSGSTITNTATVTTTTSDPNIANNSSTATSTVTTSADVGVTKTAAPTVVAGNNITYTITVINTGSSDAQGVTLNDVVPSGTTFVSETQTSGPAFTITNTPAVGPAARSPATSPRCQRAAVPSSP